MARLISYPTISTVASGDLFPVTDISDVNKPLKNITAVNLQTFVNDGATLQRVISTGNTYQASPSDVLWTWSTGAIIATSTSFTSLLSGKRFKTTFVDDGSYTDVLPNQLIFNNASGNETSITPNTLLSSNIDLQWPSSSGTLALEADPRGTSIVSNKRQAYKIRVTNKTVGSPNFNSTRTGSTVGYNRQSSSTLNWSEYSKQWTPSLDPGYDSGIGLQNTDDILVMFEESVKDIMTRLGYSSLNIPMGVMSYDNWMLASQQIDLAVRVNNAGASPGNGTTLIQLVDETSPSTGPPNLPSTVCVWFVDTADTSSNMAGPTPKIVFAGKDTAYAKIVNGGNQYSDGVTYTFTGNTGDTFRKYALLVEDEYYSNMRSTYLKVTGGRVVFQNLPTADPVSKGVVWDDAGILKISQG